MRVIVLILLSAACSGAAAEWVEAAFDKGKDFIVYIDPATIRKSGSMVKMWQMGVHKAAQVIDGMRYLSTRDQSEYDCKDERVRLLYITWYSESLGNGNALNSSDSPSNWRAVAPGTITEILWKFACGKPL